MMEESLSITPTPPSPRAESDDRVSQARRALLERPSINIRTRIAGVFLFIFALLGGVTVTALIFISKSKDRLALIERLGNYTTEVQEARRFEKNFFLYGTNLTDALDNIHMADDHLRRSADEIQSVVGREKYLNMQETLIEYQGLLQRLLEVSSDAIPGQDTEQRGLEIRLRRSGTKVLADAQEMIDRERLTVHSMLNTSMVAAVGFLIFMLFVMAYIASFIIRAVLTPLGRFVEYTARIGAGDYSPITPTRKYRDEFSNLAIAINQMLEDLVLRQEQLLRSGRMAAVGSLTSGIAHELNNPLNNIGITTEALIGGYDDYSTDERLKMLGQINTQVERASATVRNLLDFTRAEKTVFTGVSVNEVVDSTARLVGNELKLGGIELNLDFGDDLPRIRGNPRNLQQLFLNLFLNAIQAMPDGGSLDVRATVNGDGFLRVDVSDTGVGIPAQDLDKIFEPFFTTKEPGKGTGLGLSVAYGIIEKHHGRITVQSEVGRGSTFSVFLPLGKDTESQSPRGG
ncbi:MAG: ATP-binding protein [Gemmatimonadales bacterium]|jgi:signal transduction histidine kinase